MVVKTQKILLLPLFYLLSILPFAIIYKISDFFFFLVYRILRYRRKVVKLNIYNSFPEKTIAEKKILEKKYYAYLCDLILETFKTLTISKKRMLKHCEMDPSAKELFDKLYKNKESVILVLGHHGNWEWAGNTLGILCELPLYIIYHPISNKFYNDLMIKMRSRFGNKLIAMKETFRKMSENKGTSSMTAFVADQSPVPESAYWLRFLNQDTPVFGGVEKMARKLKQKVVYLEIFKKTRGYYTISANIIEDYSTSLEFGGVTQTHIQCLEKSITRQPETWLWSHRRWKHKKMADTIVH